VLAVGSALIRIETTADVNGEVHARPAPERTEPTEPVAQRPEPAEAPPPPEPASNGHARRAGSSAVSAAPAVRQRATSLGIDLATVTGTGPEGRVVHGDLDTHLQQQTTTATPRRISPPIEVSDEKLVANVAGVLLHYETDRCSATSHAASLSAGKERGGEPGVLSPFQLRRVVADLDVRERIETLGLMEKACDSRSTRPTAR